MSSCSVVCLILKKKKKRIENRLLQPKMVGLGIVIQTVQLRTVQVQQWHRATTVRAPVRATVGGKSARTRKLHGVT